MIIQDNLLTPNKLLNHQILGIEGDHLPVKDCLDLIQDHFSKWDIDQILPNDSEDVQGICDFVACQINEMQPKQVDSANDFYSRVFVKILNEIPLNTKWKGRSCVDPLFCVLTQEVKRSQVLLVLERLKREGCPSIHAIINGKPTYEELKQVIDHIYRYHQWEFISYIAELVGHGVAAEICCEKESVSWDSFNLDIIKDRDSIVRCLKKLKGESKRSCRNQLLHILRKREGGAAIQEIARETKDDWLIHEVHNFLELDDQSLFGAVKKGNADAAFKLLEQRVDLNQRCDFDFTPLHYAALRNDKRIIDLLLAAKADIGAVGGPLVGITMGFERSNPVLLAAWYDHESALEAFVANVPPVELIDRRNGFGFSARYCAYANRIERFMEVFPPSKLDQEIYRAKLLAHANGIKGTLSLSETNDIPLEGGLTYGMYREIAGSIQEGIPDEDLSKEIKDELVSAMAAASRPRSPEEILRSVHEGTLTIIPTGHHHHYRAVVIYKNQLYNVDGANPNPVIRVFLESPITLEYIQNTLFEQIQVRPTFLNLYTKRREKVQCMPKGQSVGNCSYFAPKHAFRQALSLLLENAGKARRIAKNWSTYFRIRQLRNYLIEHMPDRRPIYPPDHNLIRQAFEQIHKHIDRTTSDESRDKFSKEIKSLAALYSEINSEDESFREMKMF